MLIAHISDTHIRNLKYHYEYRQAFEDLYDKLRDQRPDIIVHTGDIAHTKTQLSPEYFELTSEFLSELASIAPLYVILGNHDGNLKNAERQDAITPIVEALQNDNIHLLKESGEVEVNDEVTLNVLSVFDRDNWNEPSNPSKINVALYHGSISGCETGQGFTITQGDDTASIFQGFDFAMLGDIHKRQQMDTEGRVWYAGSTIQQNFGESLRKGYILWNIHSKDDWTVEFHALRNPRPFISIYLDRNGDLPETHVPRDAYLRIVSQYDLPLTKLRQAVDAAEVKWRPYSTTYVNRGTKNSRSAKSMIADGRFDNLRDIKVQEELIQEYLVGKELDDGVMDKILEHNRHYNRKAEEQEEVSRNVIWSIKEMQWDNLFNYGEKNTLNFENLNGIVGIFGKNYSGKSSIIDSALYTIFNTTSKGERKNIHILNQNKTKALGRIDIQIGDNTYRITRNLDKNVSSSGNVTAKVDLDFAVFDGKDWQSLNGTTRNQTDANIRKHFGTIEDFLLTSMASQMDSLSFVKEGSTKRKEILAKFLDLDLFDSKFKLAKKDLAEQKSVIKHLRSMNWDLEIAKKTDVLDDIEIDIKDNTIRCQEIEIELKGITAQLAEINESIDAIPAEIIDIDSVNKSIKEKRESTRSLSSKNRLLESKIDVNNQTFDRVAAFIESFDLNVLTDQKEEHNRLLSLKSSNSSDIREGETEKGRLQKKIKMLDNHEYDPDCKYCVGNKFVQDAKKAEVGLRELKNRMANLKMHAENIENKISELNIEDIEEKIESFNQVVSDHDNIKAQIERDTYVLENNRKQIQLNDAMLETLLVTQATYEENKEAIENKELFIAKRDNYAQAQVRLQKEQKKCESMLQEFFIEKGSTQQAIAGYEDQKRQLEDKEREFIAHDLFLQCMHPNGIAYTVIRQMLPIINEEIAKVLTSIVDFEVFFVDNGKSLDIMLKHPKYDARPLSMGSGAEKTLSAMAIRLALISITNLPKSELFILDEPATALDQEHMDGFVKMLEMIKTQFKTVLLISHLDSLKDCADLTIDIQKQNGYARVNL
jgi:DNA repair exonuclease SbcCD ATPase subunit/DNA repair exonuclease SbcCD nuclease subunit